MSEPDEAAVEAVAQVIHDGRSRNETPWVSLSDYECARAALATPVVDGWRRDAERLRKIREVSAAFDALPWPDALKGPAVEAMAEIAAMLRGDGA